MNDLKEGVTQVQFAFGAVGLEWDEHCRVTTASKEADLLGVRAGWVVIMVGDCLANDGGAMYDLLFSSRQRSGWTAEKAQDFWKEVAKPRLERAVENWPGDCTERVNMVLSSLKTFSKQLGGEFSVCFAENAIIAESLRRKTLQSKTNACDNSSCYDSATFRTLRGEEFRVGFRPEETLRALRSRLAGLAGGFTDQVSIVLSDCTRLGESGNRRDDGQPLAACGLTNGAEATLIMIHDPGEDCQERLVDDDLSKMLRREKVHVQNMTGNIYQEFVPISYSTGLNPILVPQSLEQLDVLEQLDALHNTLEKHRHTIPTIVDCVVSMRPFGGERLYAKEMLRHPRFLNALAEYDGMHISESEARDVLNMLQRIPHNDLFGLAKVNIVAHIMARWVLAWLPSLVPGALLQEVRALQATERVVKCRVGKDSFVHLCVHISNGSACVAGVLTDKRMNDVIEWLPPQMPSKCEVVSCPKVTPKLLKRQSGAWR